MKNKKGFTLVELLAVIAILAVLVIIAMPNILKRFNEAKKNAFITEVKTAYKEATSKYIDNSLSGKSVTTFSSDNDDLDLDGEKLKYCIVTNTKGEVEYMKVANGSYYTIYDGSKMIEKYNSTDALDLTDDIDFDCSRNSKIAQIDNLEYDGEVKKGTQIYDDIYMYTYMKEPVYDFEKDNFYWKDMKEEGWSVVLYPKDPTKVLEFKKNGLSISPYEIINNDKYVISTSYMLYYYSSIYDPEKIYDLEEIENIEDEYEREIKEEEMQELQYLQEKYDLSDFNTSHIINMEGMFFSHEYWQSKLKLYGIENFDTSNVTNMSFLFYNNHDGIFGSVETNEDYVLDLTNWKTDKVTNMSAMFYKAGGAGVTKTFKGLDEWNVENVTDMSWMFAHTGSYTKTYIGDLSSWNTKNVTNMSGMFSHTSFRKNIDYFKGIDKWDTSSVVDMSYMFYESHIDGYEYNIEGLENMNVSNVQDFSYMFTDLYYYTKKINLDLSHWNTKSARNMSHMFDYMAQDATEFSLGDISKWNVENVENMDCMFTMTATHASFKLDLSEWKVSKDTTHNNFNYLMDGKIISPWD